MLSVQVLWWSVEYLAGLACFKVLKSYKYTLILSGEKKYWRSLGCYDSYETCLQEMRVPYEGYLVDQENFWSLQNSFLCAGVQFFLTEQGFLLQWCWMSPFSSPPLKRLSMPASRPLLVPSTLRCEKQCRPPRQSCFVNRSRVRGCIRA